MRKQPIEIGSEEHELAVTLRNVFSDDEGERALAWILHRAGYFDATEGERAAGRREMAVAILDAMGITAPWTLADIVSGLHSVHPETWDHATFDE